MLVWYNEIYRNLYFLWNNELKCLRDTLALEKSQRNDTYINHVLSAKPYESQCALLDRVSYRKRHSPIKVGFGKSICSLMPPLKLLTNVKSEIITHNNYI